MSGITIQKKTTQFSNDINLHYTINIRNLFNICVIDL